MDEAAYRILDILARRLGNPISINEITKNIDEILNEIDKDPTGIFWG